MAVLPLVRIRAQQPHLMQAEDFYDFRLAQSQALDALRPRRLWPRAVHVSLLPAQMHAVIQPAAAAPDDRRRAAGPNAAASSLTRALPDHRHELGGDDAAPRDHVLPAS